MPTFVPQPPGAAASASYPTRGLYHAVVEANDPLCREHYRLRLRVPGRFPPAAPGQFIQLGCGPTDAAAYPTAAIDWRPGQRPTLGQVELCEPSALLRRPFSLAGRGDDDRGTWLDVVHRVVGTGTRWLQRRRAGDTLDFIGPLGNRFTLPPGKGLGLLVGGGVGLPPMFYLAQSLAAAGWDAVAFVGAQSDDLLAVTWVDGQQPDGDGSPRACVQEFARFGYGSVVTTDDGSLGLRGLITAGLRRYVDAMDAASRSRAVLFTCGPMGMMRAAAHLATQARIDAQVCMEQAMACGMGTCQSCIVRIEDRAAPQGVTPAGRPWRYRLCCTDGPVFDAADIVW